MREILAKCKEIIDAPWKDGARGACRQLFTLSGIAYPSLKRSDFKLLKDLINLEISAMKYEDTFDSLIPELKVHKVKFQKGGVFLRCEGGYFSDREGVSFNEENPLRIGFCAELDGCNQSPFIVGFAKWVAILSMRSSA